MKKPALKWVIVAILILFIGYSGFATYNWLESERTENLARNDAVDLSDILLWELSDAGSVAEYLIGSNATDELLNERIHQYFCHARTLSYSSSMLQALTIGEKYSLLGTAMRDLQTFLVAIGNHEPGDAEEALATNLDALKQMDGILGRVLRIDNLTLADAQNLLELAGNLTAG
jgi:hypothetical protein